MGSKVTPNRSTVAGRSVSGSRSNTRQNVAKLYVQASQITGKPVRADIRKIVEGKEHPTDPGT